MSFFTEFKTFLMKGEIVNLATAVIVGSAFGKIVSSLTNDILMPPIGFLLGKVDFKNLKLVIQKGVPELTENGIKKSSAIAEVSINYGNFIQTIFDFIIIGFCIFIILKAYEKTKKTTTNPEKTPTPEDLLTDIKNILTRKL